MSKYKTIIKNALLMILLGFVFEIVCSFLLTRILTFFPDIAAQYSEQIDSLIEKTAEMFFLVVIISPIIEELIFRFCILGIFNKFSPFWLANVIQAGCFGIYHMNIVQGIYAFLLGLFIGYIKKRYKNIMYCILFHMSLNFAGFNIEILEKYIPGI